MNTVEAVNRYRREILLTDGTVLKILTMFDDEAEETLDPDEAEVGVARLPDGRWLSVRLAAFEPATIH